MRVILDIIDMGMDAVGVAKYNDKIVFIKDAIVGEQVEAEIVKENKSYCQARLIKVLKCSPFRQYPKCPYYNNCGGCNLQHINYDFALQYKTQYLTGLVKKMTGYENVVKSIIPSNPYNYRNKQVFNISKINNEVCVGMYSEMSHNAIPIQECMLDQDFSKSIITATKEFINKYNLSIYNPKTSKGLLKYIMVRKLNNKHLIVLVTTQNFEKAKYFVDILKKYFKDFSLDLNINKKNNNLILSQDYIHIYGTSIIESQYVDDDFSIKYVISPNSFMQINNDIRDKIYKFVSNLCKGYEQVVDAYSGAGLLSAIICKKVKMVYGLEIVKSATEDADKLKEINALNNLININIDCAVGLPKLIKENRIKDFCLVLDPPRKGVDQSVITTIKNTLPKRIIYVSCNPATLCRDIKEMCCFGKYELQSIQPFDMFPQTSHIESVAIINLIKE